MTHAGHFPDLPPHFRFSLSNPDHTGLQLVALHDARTDFTVRTALAQSGKQVPAIMAFAGARFSRSALTAEELFAEINTSRISAQQKLANIFLHYGHASVGDMAMLFAYLENVPRSLMMEFFYSSSVGGGQERSSRYQSFGQAQAPRREMSLPNQGATAEEKQLLAESERLFRHLISLYEQFLPQVDAAYRELYQPDPDSKGHASALTARVFDTVRCFLPAGTPTSGAYVTSAREWARIIQAGKSHWTPEWQCLGEQLELLFAPPETLAEALGYTPEAPDLIRYTKPITQETELRAQLELFLQEHPVTVTPSSAKAHPLHVHMLPEDLDATEKHLYLRLLMLRPNLTEQQFSRWLKKLKPAKQRQLSALLFASFTHHVGMPGSAQTGGYTFEVKTTLSEAIDLNRHRAWGRFTPFLESQDIRTLALEGFQLPLYLDHPQLKPLKQAFTQALQAYWKDWSRLVESAPDGVASRFFLNLLPNATQIRYFLTGGPKEISYLTQLRVRPGGHINYRQVAYEMARVAGKQGPLLHTLDLGVERKPDPFSAAEFFDRS